MKIKVDRSKDFFKWKKIQGPKCKSGIWQDRAGEGKLVHVTPMVSSWGFLAGEEVG